MPGISFSEDVLKDCRVTGGKLLVPGVGLDYDRLTEEVYKAVVDYKVPHYRVVGCSVRENGRPPETIVANIPGLMMNLIELEQQLSKIVLSRKVGEWYAPDEDGVDSVLTHVSSEAEELAHICVTGLPDRVVVATNSFYGFGQVAENIRVLTNEPLFRTGHNTEIYVYLRRGTGTMEFEDCDALFKRVPSIVPCRTVYDLTEIFMVKPYSGKPEIELDYFKDVNEDVLTEIFRNTILNGGY